MPRNQLIADLQRALPPNQILSDPDELAVYEADAFTIAHARPAAVVFAQSTQDVASAVKIIASHGTQIVPRGSGTGLAGGSVAFDLGVIISTARMNRILKIDLDNRLAHVQAGVRNTALSDAVANLALQPDQQIASRYHFAPDPSSQRASTIGGNAATNAGGIHTLKDFVTSNHIVGLELVLPDGTILNLGGQDGAYESGPFDLPGIVCGSEGTFGIITSLWVRLVPKPLAFRTLVAIYSSSADACNTVSDVIAAGFLPAAMEMLDGSMIQTVEDAFHLGFPREAKALLLIEIDAIPDLIDRHLEEVFALCNRHHPISLEFSADPARRAAMWKARKSAFGAIGRISRSACTQDACVPRSKLAEVLAEIDRIGIEHGMQISNVFHAGDGNVHPIFLYDDRDEAQVQNTLRASEKVLKYCIDVGGTLTGEHGVGVEKLPLMPYMFDRPTMDQFARIKKAFDPHDRINAGKLLPSETIKVSLLKPAPYGPQ